MEIIMIVSLITEENFSFFQSLLLPQIVSSYEEGDPYLLLGAVEDEVACGAIAGQIIGHTLELHSLYVAPDYRLRGAGRQMVETLFKGCLETHIYDASIDFAVTLPEHSTLLPFLTALQFVPEPDDDQVCRLTLETLTARPFFQKSAPQRSDVKPLREIPAIYLKEKSAGHGNLDAALPDKGLLDPAIDTGVSVGVVREQMVRGYLTFSRREGGGLTLSMLQADATHNQYLPILLRTSCGLLNAHYPPDTQIYVQAVNASGGGLVRELLGDLTPVTHSWRRALLSGTYISEEITLRTLNSEED